MRDEEAGDEDADDKGEGILHGDTGDGVTHENPVN